MPVRKASSLHRVLGRLDNLDAAGLASLVQRLARERALLETVFDAIREGILVVDGGGIVQYANEAAARLLGFREDDLPERPLAKILPGLGGAAGLGTEDDGAAPVVSAREIEITYPEPRIVRVYVVPFREEPASGPGRSWAVILSDVTSERASTRERIESERLSSIFLLAAGVAHEIGNPLNSLDIHLQLLERQVGRARGRGPASAAGLRDTVRICREEVQRLDGIIRHFLEAIRPQPPDLQELRPVELIEETLRFLGRELADRGVRVAVEAGDFQPPIRGDREQLKQVLFNLFKNAMEAMTAGGCLTVQAGADDEAYHLVVRDTGSGIRADDLARLFTPFHTTKKGGHGLGLMIVERILRAHGARIGIESREGEGAVVRVQFPLRERRVRLLGPAPSAGR